MKKTWRIVQYIYEERETEPTLMHVFYGETRGRAWAVFQAHMQTDAFMRGCVTSQRFRDFSCHTAEHTERLGPDGRWVQVDDVPTDAPPPREA